MCGISGYWQFSTSSLMEHQSVLEKMSSSLRHRGPDDSGYWFDKDEGVGLSHRRLSILDLSAAGHQPMSSSNDRYVLVFNGEIYNHRQLRLELDAGHKTHGWNGYSDTETLLMCIANWGLATTLPKLRGMFAFALWDSQEKQLHLVRDRYGEKPLYYGWVEDAFVFGSELKA